MDGRSRFVDAALHSGCTVDCGVILRDRTVGGVGKHCSVGGSWIVSFTTKL